MSAGLSTVAGSATIPERVIARGTAWRTVLGPVVLGVVMIGVWQGIVDGFGIDEYIVPSPTDIAGQIGDNAGSIVDGSLRTGANALIGLIVGAVVGILGAIVAGVWRIFDTVVAPIVAALAVMPIVALAPVLYTMYGADKETARQIVAAVAVIVPVYINTLRGLRQVRPVHRDLMRVYAASARQQQLAVTLPTAAPYVFTGLRIASSLAVISSLVAEYFGGPVSGLGKSITSSAASSNYSLAWAYVVGAIVLGLVFYCAALAIELFFTRHRPGT